MIETEKSGVYISSDFCCDSCRVVTPGLSYFYSDRINLIFVVVHSVWSQAEVLMWQKYIRTSIHIIQEQSHIEQSK